MRAMIYAVSPDGVIGRGGTLAWHYAGDHKRFKRLTMGGVLVMGRATFESIGKALPGRRTIVVTSRPVGAPLVEVVGSIEAALERAGDSDVWFAGGARIYDAAMSHVDLIDVTYVPDRVETQGAVFGPTIDERTFEAGPLLQHEEDPRLTRREYHRRREP
jgi:dihydrofolate reductase